MAFQCRVVDVMLMETMLVGVFSLLLASVLAVAAENIFKYELVEVESTDIIALSNNTQSNISLFLGTGNVDENSVYYYMEDTEKGALMNHVMTENTFINETSNGESNVKKYENEFTNNVLEKLLKFNFGDVDEVIFNVPNGTIDKDFSVDLNNN